MSNNKEYSINEIRAEKPFRYRAGIYYIKNLINGKLYIGSSKNLYERFLSHIKTLLKNKHCNIYLQNSFNKNKENFVFGVFEDYNFEGQDVLIKREQYYLDKFNSYSRNFGYNILDKAGITPMSNCVKVLVFKTNGKFLKNFDSCSEAERVLNVPAGSFKNVLNKTQKSSKGYTVFKEFDLESINSFKENPLFHFYRKCELSKLVDKVTPLKDKNSISFYKKSKYNFLIKVYDFKNRNLIKSFSNFTEASRFSKVSNSILKKNIDSFVSNGVYLITINKFLKEFYPENDYKDNGLTPGLELNCLDNLKLVTTLPFKEGTNLGIAYVKTKHKDIIATSLGGFLQKSDNPNCRLILTQDCMYELHTIKSIEPEEILTINY